MLKTVRSTVNVDQIIGVLPVVNGGTGVTTSTGTGSVVLSAAPTLSGDVTLSTGNIVPGTAAKGINFTANTPAAGMTSQLLNWYEEGTWTPTDGSGAGLTITKNSAKYTRIGNRVDVYCDVTYPATASSADMNISNLPFTAITDSAGCIGYTDYAPPTPLFAQLSSGIQGIRLQTSGGATLTNVTISTKRFQISSTYFI